MGFERSRKELEGKPIEANCASEQVLVVQIPTSEIYEDAEEPQTDPAIKNPQEKTSWFKRHLSYSKPKKEATIGIRMTKADFMAFFARDQATGQYKDGVVEPPEGRKAWLQKRLPENDGQVWDLRTVQSRQLVQTRGIGYYGGLVGPLGE